PAALVGLGLALWIVYALWLALQGSSSTPSFERMLWPSIGAMIIGIAIAISRAVTLTSGPFWEASRSIPRELSSAPRRAIVRPIPLGGVMAGVGFAVTVAVTGLLVGDVRDSVLLQNN